MATFAQKAAALQQAQADQQAVDTPTTRRAVADARTALQTSPEATAARGFHNARVRNGR